MFLIFIFVPVYCLGDEPNASESFDPDSFDPAVSQHASVVDRSTLDGKIMCGYQGWFNCDGDGTHLGWIHWARDRKKNFAPGNVTFDLWPDMKEYEADERYQTGFRLPDGSPAEVFSSANRKTVLRHFRWMRDYNIDGAFIQRFANGLTSDSLRLHTDNVLMNASDACEMYGRTFAVMYDLSGINLQKHDKVVEEDWLRLKRELAITESDAYLNHDGKPVVAIWGVGFSDKRSYSLDYCEKLIDWFQAQGVTVMLGVPSYWRDQTRDTMNDPHLHDVLRKADILSPWSVGRYSTPAQATEHGKDVWGKDRQWCDAESIDFLPVVFPGFSWFNLNGDPIDSIPRLKGKFLKSQIIAAKNAGARMIYVAMFDEVDEATAVFKCTNQPPVGDGVHFIDYEGLPSDYYLRMLGAAKAYLHD